MDALALPICFMQLDVPLMFAGVLVCIISKAVHKTFRTEKHNAITSDSTPPQKDKEVQFISPFKAEVDRSRAEPGAEPGAELGAEPDAEPSTAQEISPKSSVLIGRWKIFVMVAILAWAFSAVDRLRSQPGIIDDISAPYTSETVSMVEKQSSVDLASELKKRTENLAGIGDHHSPALAAIGGLADDEENSSAMSEIDQLSEEIEDIWGEDDGDCFAGEPALVVKLTREIVEINHKTNYVKSDYHGTILVGTPGLPMTVVFDTGSGHLLLPSMYCKTQACKVHTRYRRSGSTTGRDINFNGSAVVRGLPRDSITVEFGTGEATGVVVEDIICMGPETNATVDTSLWKGQDGLQPGCMKMHFLAASDLSEDPFINFGFDGVLGLSLVGLSQTPHHNFLTMLSHLVEDRHQCASQSFGVFLPTMNKRTATLRLGVGMRGTCWKNFPGLQYTTHPWGIGLSQSSRFEWMMRKWTSAMTGDARQLSTRALRCCLCLQRYSGNCLSS